jgi:hypothetical protein
MQKEVAETNRVPSSTLGSYSSESGRVNAGGGLATMNKARDKYRSESKGDLESQDAPK